MGGGQKRAGKTVPRWLPTRLKGDLLAATNALRGRYCVQAGIAGEEFDQLVREMTQEWETYRPTCTFCATYGKRVSV